LGALLTDCGIRRLTYPLKNTAFGLGVYSTRDTAAEADAWLSELLQRSCGMPGELTVFSTQFPLSGILNRQIDTISLCFLRFS
jgi:hypothetical protein